MMDSAAFGAFINRHAAGFCPAGNDVINHFLVIFRHPITEPVQVCRSVLNEDILDFTHARILSSYCR